MNVSQRTWRLSTTALKTTMAAQLGYEIPSDQPKAVTGVALDRALKGRAKRLGLNGLGALAFAPSAGNA